LGGVMSPYYLHFWGSICNDDLVERELGITSNDQWFETEAEREALIERLQGLARKHDRCCMTRLGEGQHTLRRSVAKLVFRHAGRDHPVTHPSPFCGLEGEEGATRFSFEDGNYACDCNRAMLMGLPDMECGDTIEMVSLEFTDEPAHATQSQWTPAVRPTSDEGFAETKSVGGGE
jgi:hypothetical protein